MLTELITSSLPEKREAILVAAAQEFNQHGIKGATLEGVASRVGLLKASVNYYYRRKEDLAAAAMVRVIGLAQAFLASLPAAAPPLDQLKAIARWMLELQIKGEMPSLPSQNSSLRANLMSNKAYLDGLMQISDQMGGWIEAAQADGSLSASVPPLVVLYTLYARACDPVPGFLKAGGQHSDEEIVDLVLATCFDGLNTR